MGQGNECNPGYSSFFTSAGPFWRHTKLPNAKFLVHLCQNAIRNQLISRPQSKIHSNYRIVTTPCSIVIFFRNCLVPISRVIEIFDFESKWISLVAWSCVGYQHTNKLAKKLVWTRRDKGLSNSQGSTFFCGECVYQYEICFYILQTKMVKNHPEENKNGSQRFFNWRWR